MIEVGTQTAVFLQSLVLGFAFGLLYDVFRVLRLAVRHSTAVIFAEDFLFFGMCAIATFLFSLSAINGHVRIFLIIGELLGATVYYVTLGVLVIHISKTIISIIKAILHFVYRVFIAPPLHVFACLFRFFKKMGQKLGTKAKKIRVNAKYSLKRQSLLVYNLFKKRKLASIEKDMAEGRDAKCDKQRQEALK